VEKKGGLIFEGGVLAGHYGITSSYNNRLKCYKETLTIAQSKSYPVVWFGFRKPERLFIGRCHKTL